MFFFILIKFFISGVECKSDTFLTNAISKEYLERDSDFNNKKKSSAKTADVQKEKKSKKSKKNDKEKSKKGDEEE